MKNSTQLLRLIWERKGFLLAVYGTLIAELLVTFAIIYGLRMHPLLSGATRQSFLLYFLLSMGVILILTLMPMPIWLKLVFMTIFAIIFGAMLHNATFAVSEQLITQSLIGTISIFVTLTIVGGILAAMGLDLSWMGLLLLGALIGLIIATLVVMVLDKKSKGWQKALLIIGLVLFSVYIVYDTNILLQRNYKHDFVTAALDFYLDIINVFIRMIALDSS